MADQQTLTPTTLSHFQTLETSVDVLALTLVWSRDEPGRLGEVMLIPASPTGTVWMFGRSAGQPQSEHRYLELFRQRPGRLDPTGPIQAPRVSREQLRIRVAGPELLEVENVGRCPLRLGEGEVARGEVRPGELIELKDQLMLLCVKRTMSLLPVPPDQRLPLHPFGEADRVGLVGESPAMWELRQQIAFVAPRHTHVLILGASGTGKELAAGAIHQLSARAKKPMVARNAATFPETLIDAELFGNAKNYPNPGMAERPGLIGEADGSTLFLDEIGELPVSLQAHLLRVLDQGKYQRLGDSNMRRSDLRLVAATNRPESALKHDVLARLRTRINMPDLNSRREDVPLIARHLMRRIASRDPEIAQRFFSNGTPTGDPRFTPALMRALVRHYYLTNVRELDGLLWQSMSRSTGNYLDVHEEMQFRATPPRTEEATPEPEVDPASLTPAEIQACLDKHHGIQDRVWRELRLPNRFVLYRLIKKYNLVVRRPGEDGESQAEE